jgi:hypothetical protein
LANGLGDVLTYCRKPEDYEYLTFVEQGHKIAMTNIKENKAGKV